MFSENKLKYWKLWHRMMTLMTVFVFDPPRLSVAQVRCLSVKAGLRSVCTPVRVWRCSEKPWVLQKNYWKHKYTLSQREVCHLTAKTIKGIANECYILLWWDFYFFFHRTWGNIRVCRYSNIDLWIFYGLWLNNLLKSLSLLLNLGTILAKIFDKSWVF